MSARAAGADQRARRLDGNGRDPVPGEHVVERVDQIRRGLGERAVEIEDERQRHQRRLAVKFWIFLQAASRLASEVA